MSSSDAAGISSSPKPAPPPIPLEVQIQELKAMILAVQNRVDEIHMGILPETESEDSDEDLAFSQPEDEEEFKRPKKKAKLTYTSAQRSTFGVPQGRVFAPRSSPGFMPNTFRKPFY